MSEKDVYGVFNQIIIRAIHFCVVGGLITPLNIGWFVLDTGVFSCDNVVSGHLFPGPKSKKLRGFKKTIECSSSSY